MARTSASDCVGFDSSIGDLVGIDRSFRDRVRMYDVIGDFTVTFVSIHFQDIVINNAILEWLHWTEIVSELAACRALYIPKCCNLEFKKLPFYFDFSSITRNFLSPEMYFRYWLPHWGGNPFTTLRITWFLRKFFPGQNKAYLFNSSSHRLVVLFFF